MGYYTNYELSMKVKGEYPEGADFGSIREEIEEVSGYGGCLFEQENKWYDHDENMIQISSKYPTILFELSGIGEEHGDMWITYYKAGKSQKCQAEIVFPPFDENMMK